MAIYMTARWSTQPGTETEVILALKEFIQAVQKNEPGTKIYTALQEKGNPNAFMTYFIFENESAREFHRNSEWVKKFTSIIYPVKEGEVEFTEYQLIASTDEPE